jgi:vitamin B12 transporter
MSTTHRFHRPLIPALVLLPLAGPALAQTAIPEVVVYATQTPVEASRVGAAVSVVTGQQLRERGVTTIADALRDVPGLSVSQSGPRGGLTEIRMRGGEANHLLVLIDGVSVNGVDNGNFNFADLGIDDIERIEVIRGPQSGLYGANAHTGVIAITTISGRGKAPTASVKIEGGSPGAWGVSGTASGSRGPAYGALTLSQNGTEGFNVSRFGSERDGSRAFVGTAKAGIDVTPDLNIEGTLRFTDRFAKSDPQDSACTFDPVTFACPPTNPRTFGKVIDGGDTNDYQSVAARLAATWKLFDGRWTHTAFVSHFAERYSFFDSDNTDFFNASGTFAGDRSVIGYKTSYRFDTPAFFGASHTVTAGIEHERETFSRYATVDLADVPQKGRSQTGAYVEWLMDFRHGLSLGAAIRHDDFQGFEDATTWRLTAAQRFEATGTRVRASVGTAVNKPTFIEQFVGFGNFIPNPDLTPEKSTGWDVGIDQTLMGGKVRLSATYFASRMTDEILTIFNPDFSSTVGNSDGVSRRSGIELSAGWDVLDWLTVNGSYTYVRSVQDDDEEIRRPPHSGSVSATARFHEGKGRLTVGAAYTGRTPDNFFGTFPATRVQLPAYWLASAQLSYDWTKNLTAYVRAENIFDQRSEDVFSYVNPGFTAMAGIRYRFGE